MAPSSRPAAVFIESYRKTCAFLKSSPTIEEAFVRSIPLAENRGVLLPVGRFHLDDAVLIAEMSRAREAHSYAFPSRFQVTTQGTRRWLEAGVLDVEDRVLFLVLDRFGHMVGHIGFANPKTDGALSLELDNVVRTNDDAEPGLMAEASRALVEWARCTVWPDVVHLRVLADNQRAIAFYERLGYAETSREPLKEVQVEEGTRLEPLDGEGEPDNSFVSMTLDLRESDAPDAMILTAGPSMSAREASYAWDAARTGWNSRWSGYLDRFESEFADYVGVEYALATSSCTGALHLALAALGVGPGDEVIVPDATWVASATAILYVGATPVFVDVQAETWCLDPELIEAKITPKTKAIVPVHMYGHPADMVAISEIAARHGIPVVEDAAPSIGSECRGRKAGSFGTISAFSFQGAKMLVTGEGGMLLTDDKELFEAAKKLWDHGRSYTRQFWIDKLGFKYKMSNVQAAIGLGQIQRADEQVEAKRRIFGWYRDGLQGVKGFELLAEAEWAYSNYWMTSGMVGTDARLSRDELQAFLKNRNVDSRPVFPAISQYPIWPTHTEPAPVALAIGERGINLPSGVCLKKTQVDRVCAAMREALGD